MARRTPTTRTRRTQGQNTSSTKTYRSRTSSTTCSRTSRTRSRNNTASNQVAINPCQGRPVLSCAHRTSVLRVSVNSGSKTNTRTTRRRCGISKSDVRMMMMIQIATRIERARVAEKRQTRVCGGKKFSRGCTGGFFSRCRLPF